MHGLCLQKLELLGETADSAELGAGVNDNLKCNFCDRCSEPGCTLEVNVRISPLRRDVPGQAKEVQLEGAGRVWEKVEIGGSCIKERR